MLLRSLPALLLLASGSELAAGQFVPGTIHTIFSTECNRYFDWQSLGLVHSARAVGQAGPITRLMACNECAARPARTRAPCCRPSPATCGCAGSPLTPPATLRPLLTSAPPSQPQIRHRH